MKLGELLFGAFAVSQPKPGKKARVNSIIKLKFRFFILLISFTNYALNIIWMQIKYGIPKTKISIPPLSDLCCPCNNQPNPNMHISGFRENEETPLVFKHYDPNKKLLSKHISLQESVFASIK